MKKVVITMTAFAFLSLMACKDDKKTVDKEVDANTEKVAEDAPSEIKKVAFKLASKSNSTATGSVVFSEKNGVVTLNANLAGLDAGTHAIHIHEKADCSSDDAKSSGGHWNPTFKNHGKWGVDTGYHKGDIGNFEADADGNGLVSMNTDEWCIGCDDPNKNILGKAIVVHQGVDDFTSQPSGAAGARVSCGGIIQ